MTYKQLHFGGGDLGICALSGQNMWLQRRGTIYSPKSSNENSVRRIDDDDYDYCYFKRGHAAETQVFISLSLSRTQK